MKKAISLLLCLVLVLGMAPAALAAENTANNPGLYDSSTEWSHRIRVSDYVLFCHSLQYNMTTNLMKPNENLLLENGNYGILIREYTGTAPFTYDANAADPAAAAEEAAAAAIAAAIAEAGNPDLATVNAYARAIYDALLQDNPEVFWMGSEILEDEVLTSELTCEEGTGNASYIQSFYFYTSTADGTFDIRAEDYRNHNETFTLYQSLQTTARNLYRSNMLTNRPVYEVLLNTNQWLTENNTPTPAAPSATLAALPLVP